MNVLTRDFWRSWPVLLLAGPSLWMLHFWVVYLSAEAGCVLQPDAVTFVTLASTGVAIAAIAWFGLRAYAGFRISTDHRRLLLLLGAQLAVLSGLATLLVGLPAAFLVPC